MRRGTYRKGRLLKSTLISSGLVLTVWTALLVVLNGKIWFFV